MYEETKALVRKLYKNDKGEPFELTDGQAQIFEAIFTKKDPRVHINTHTRYGKSETVSMAVLTRIATYPEKFAIVAGEEDKARIIMSYVIKHIFDNEYTKNRFVLDKNESFESIRRYKNKDRINFKVGNGLFGEVFICSGKKAMGLGAPNIIEDESALINSQDHAFIMRMLGDQPENFLCKIGNPFESDHFRASAEDPSYKHITIDYQQGIREGRLTPQYIDEMRKQPFFDILYECKFPPQGSIDDQGWLPLLTRDEIDKAMIDYNAGYKGFGIRKMGVDVAGGGRNYSVIVIRYSNYAKITLKSQNPDTMTLVENILTQKEQEDIGVFNISIDMVGIGRGVYDMTTRLKPGVRGVNPGESLPIERYYEDSEKFTNLRAYMFWKLREWIINGGKLIRSDDWYQLTKIKYRAKLEGTKGKLQIMSKEDMLKDGIQSPDVADALSMTFVTNDVVEMSREELDKLRNEEGSFDPFSPFPEV